MLKNKFLQTSKITLLSGLCILTVCQQALNAGVEHIVESPDPESVLPNSFTGGIRVSPQGYWVQGFYGDGKEDGNKISLVATFRSKETAQNMPRPKEITKDEVTIAPYGKASLVGPGPNPNTLQMLFIYDCSTSNQSLGPNVATCTMGVTVEVADIKNVTWKISSDKRSVTWSEK